MKSMKTLPIFCLLLLSSIFSPGCKDQPENKVKTAKGTFMGMRATNTPQLLFPEFIASSLDEYNGTFSPDGTEFFFTTNTPSQGIICYTRMDPNGRWAEPIIAPFSGTYSEYDPLFSPDGKRLYFSSERPVSKTDSSGKTNIWYVERLDTAWSDPSLLELEKTGTYYSSITRDGSVYFNIWDTGDMYKASKRDTGYQIERLPDVLNSENGEGDPFISPDESYLIYRGYNNSLGRGDLYISYKIDGQWTPPENLGEPINSAHHEMCPYVTSDGKYFIFASSRMAGKYDSKAGDVLDVVRGKHRSYDNGQLNIYYISADFIEEGKKKHL